jgi:hypothetical protein
MPQACWQQQACGLIEGDCFGVHMTIVQLTSAACLVIHPGLALWLALGLALRLALGLALGLVALPAGATRCCWLVLLVTFWLLASFCVVVV